MTIQTNIPTSRSTVARSVARLAAVQALYQIDRGGDAAKEVVGQFLTHRLKEVIDGDKLSEADQEFFSDLVTCASERREELDAAISRNLAKDWRMERLDPLLLQVIRAGLYELMARPDIPTAVVIDEYVDVAHAFYEAAEAKFVNGILDKLAKESRG